VPRFLADENFNQRIVRGLRRRLSGLDLVLARDVGLGGSPDPDLLDWAATNGRVILSHDIRTLVPAAHARIEAGLPMPGVVVAADDIPIGPAIDDILLLHLASTDAQFENQVIYLPL
jgi:predicted nuclease of predicted toxin-antitoxin system